jgi:hypothetical protein
LIDDIFAFTDVFSSIKGVTNIAFNNWTESIVL